MSSNKDEAVKALWDAVSDLLEDPDVKIPLSHRDTLNGAVENIAAAFKEYNNNPKRGPGKFSSDLDAVLRSISLDGPDEELGDSETFNHYSLLADLSADEVEEAAEDAGVELSADELEEVDGASAIIEENSQGFVSVELFDSEAAARKKWAALEKEWEKFAEAEE